MLSQCEKWASRIVRVPLKPIPGNGLSAVHKSEVSFKIYFIYILMMHIYYSLYIVFEQKINFISHGEF
jgi:hypothetical protein